MLLITAAQNVLAGSVLSDPRELSWSYSVAGVSQAHMRRYRLQAILPFGVSEDGVRRKLGIGTHELADDGVDLTAAFGRFRSTFETTTWTAALTATDHTALLIGDAIEATAALTLLPSLQISLASKESSGTNQFQRAGIDWELLRQQLQHYLLEGQYAVNPLTDPVGNYGSLLIMVVRTDPVTGV